MRWDAFKRLPKGASGAEESLLFVGAPSRTYRITAARSDSQPVDMRTDTSPRES